MTLDRRSLMASAATMGLGIGLGTLFGADTLFAAGRPDAPFKLTDAQWKQRLSPQAYAVLRQAATERAFTSPLNDEHRKGIFHCAGCDLANFDSKTKFDSGTGWPSFWTPIPRSVATSKDTELGYERTEVHCVKCGGHLGHVFEDGPKPTGLRYCMNGVALKFVPA